MAVFDEAFLEARLKKQAEWRKKGVRTGSGNPFSEVVDISKRTNKKSELFPSSNFETPLVHTASTIDTRECPDWLVDIIRSDTEIQRALSEKKFKPDSPHKRALIALAKAPGILKGQPEHYIQVRLFYVVEREHPLLYRAMKAVPNGGLRSKTTAGKMRAEGQKAGAPDIDVDMARGAYHGMKLEVKTDKGHLQQNQVEALEFYNSQGYYAVCGKGFDECYDHLTKYLYLPPFDNVTKIEN
ncbi:PDDEXK family nuclease [Photobacterium leiognathi]|uniref:hypothetical protein n=1 Tax=Photobacterium leiognathi TaxID=553611 RepID=UPI002980C294|nr:hypothetical protein [Photobacterium leiognathi]